MTDPIADLLTRIRNATRVRHPSVSMPHSTMKVHLLEVLKREGFVGEFKVVEGAKPYQNMIKVYLKYSRVGESVIQEIKRISKPGLRVYRPVEDLKPVLNGIGIAIVSTSNGILSDRECRKEHVGGEVLCTVS